MMNNGQANGAPYGQPVQINPVQAAQFALMFLQRTDMKPTERDAYAIAEGMLNAIVQGQVVLAPPARAMIETPPPEPPAPIPKPGDAPQ